MRNLVRQALRCKAISYLEAVRLLAWEAQAKRERNPYLELPPDLQPAMDVLILLSLPASQTLH